MGDVTILGIGEIGKDIALNLAEYEVYDIINIKNDSKDNKIVRKICIPLKSAVNNAALLAKENNIK